MATPNYAQHLNPNAPPSSQIKELATRIVPTPAAHIADATDATDVITRVNLILDVLEANGLVAEA